MAKWCPVSELGERIRAGLLARDMQHQELARRIGVSAVTVSKIIRGRVTSPHWLMMVAIADVLDLSLDDLAGRGRKAGTLHR